MLSTANAGTAYVQGWEFSYQQQFTFLPGLLKGLSGLVNYTVLDTHGNYGGAGNLGTGQVAGFVPRTANASLNWKYRGFAARLLINYAGKFLQTFGGVATPTRNVWRMERNLVNLGFSYQLRPWLNVTLDIDNLNNEPQRRYRYIESQMEYFNYPGTGVTVGFNGRF
jgi:outer membrane receptor protein involved in Fe transport